MALLRNYLSICIKFAALGVLAGLGCFALWYTADQKSERSRISDKLRWGVAVAYFVALEAAVLFGGETVEYRAVNIYPFEAFRLFLAYGSSAEILQYAFKILAFVPCGLLLCSATKGHFGKSIALIMAISLSNEFVQYEFGLGMADIDDLMANTFGGLWGCLMFGFFHSLKMRDGFGIYSYVNLSVLLVAAIIISLYLGKPYGYLPSDFINSQHIKPDRVDCSAIEGSLPESLAYYMAAVDKDNDAELEAKRIFALFGQKLSEDYVDESEDFSIYWARESNSFLWFWDDGNFDLSFTQGLELNNEEKVLELLDQNGFTVPKNIVLQEKNTGEFFADCNLLKDSGTVYDGFISFEYLDGKLYSISYQIKELVYVESCSAITAEKLEKRLLKGRFQLEKAPEDLSSIKVLEYSVDYIKDGKGYYRPVYIILAEADGTEVKLTVSAVM